MGNGVYQRITRGLGMGPQIRLAIEQRMSGRPSSAACSQKVQQRILGVSRFGATCQVMDRIEQRMRLALFRGSVLQIVPDGIDPRGGHIRIRAQVEGPVEDFPEGACLPEFTET